MKLSFEFSADTAVLANIGELLIEAAHNAGFEDSEINDVQLAVDEACTNTIIHGLKEDPSKTFHLGIRWETGEIEIFIHEAGAHFDLTNVPTPDVKAPLEDRSVGGLGIFLIKKLMDEVEYQVGDDGAKTLRMVKRSARPKK